MKKILLSLFIMAVIGFTAKVRAQACTIAQSSILVNIKSIVNNPGGGCTTVFDLTYDIDGNNGNKWSHLHFWDATAYPTISYSGTGPNLSQLNGGAGSPTPVLRTLSLDYQTGTNDVSPSYPPDGSVPVQTAGIAYTRTAISGTITRFAITNISVTTNNCSPLNLKLDVWSSQANNGKITHCAVTGLSVQADEPQMLGLIQCVSPRTYTVSFKTNTTRTMTWNVYRDMAPTGVFDATDQLNLLDGPRMVSNPGGGFNTYGTFPLSPQSPGSLFNIWIVATASGISNSNAILVVNTCASLPVNIISFSASRNHSNVMLKWETNWEQNSSGFSIERNTDGSWQEVAFVASQAQGGNSSDLLNYQYIDINNSKGISQYRLRQVDFDNKSKFSEIRTVRGESQIGKIIVYPNPTFDGKVNVSFEDANVIRDISLIDMNGRIINQWKAFTTNQLSIGNLTPGLYTLRVVLPETGEQIVEKIVVNKR